MIKAHYPDELDEFWPHGSVITLTCDRHADIILWLVLPAIAQLSRQNRWIVWVAPPQLPSARLLEKLGLNLSHTLFAYRREAIDDVELIEQALLSRTNSVVLAWPRRCDALIFTRLQSAAKIGQTRGLIFFTDTATHMETVRTTPFRATASGIPEQLSLDVSSEAQP